MNILLLTSCNRIKQTLFALSLNCQTIKNQFSIVIVDNSTPKKDKSFWNQHQADDPYNVVKENNYCSDINLLYEAQDTFKEHYPHIEDFKVIHSSPRLVKQPGEATLISLGLSQAALMGFRYKGNEKNFCLKINGVSILKWDIITKLPELLNDCGVLTYHRANIGGWERSTRVFACRPEELNPVLLREGWYNWCDDNSGVTEQRLPRILDRNIPDRTKFAEAGDDSVLLEGGGAFNPLEARQKITDFIERMQITTDKPYIDEFVKGGIW
jgi:hypothetical protein